MNRPPMTYIGPAPERGVGDGRKRIAILCSGPSLVETWSKAPGQFFDQVIAVNEAGTYGPCDWWQIHDIEAPLWWMRSTCIRRGICTWKHVWNSMMIFPRWKEEKLEWIDAEKLPDAGFRYHCLSMLGAMALAVQLDADEAHLFGVDWSGNRSFAGTFDEGRDPGRWATEQQYFERLVKAWPQTHFVRHLAGGGTTWHS